MHKFVVGVLLCLITSLSWADTKIGSWNIARLGNGDQKSFPALANIAKEFDFFAVQEVMNEPALVSLDQALEKASGEKWEYLNSHLVGRGSYKEMYAFFWRSKRIEYVDGAVVYLDRKNLFEREPFSARFRTLEDGQTFVASTVHILYGKSEADRTPEIRELANYWAWLHEVYPETGNMLLMGDFNLNPKNPAWRPLKQVARPLITSGASTLSQTDGKFSNLYDNIWISKTSPMNVQDFGIVNYPKIIGWSNERSRKQVSDHAPVFVSIGAASAQNRVTKAPELASQQLSVAKNDTILVKGNLKSNIYHLPQCASYAKVSEMNTVLFNSERDAQAAGYKRASNCK